MPHRNALWRHARTTDVRDLGRAALFDRNRRTIWAANVESGDRRGDVERNSVRVGENGDGICSDLVRGVAVCGDAIRTDDHGVELPLLEEMAGHVVGDQRDVDAFLMQ